MSKDAQRTYQYFLDIQTRWNDNDIYGHINNAVYYTWFDTLVNNFLIEKVCWPWAKVKPLVWWLTRAVNIMPRVLS